MCTVRSGGPRQGESCEGQTECESNDLDSSSVWLPVTSRKLVKSVSLNWSVDMTLVVDAKLI